jgi:hypothetical protein
MPLQSDFLRDVVEFLMADFVKLFATRLELLVDLDRLFRSSARACPLSRPQAKLPSVVPLCPSESSPTPTISAFAFFFPAAFDIN